jgi:hypothetical protein
MERNPAHEVAGPREPHLVRDGPRTDLLPKDPVRARRRVEAGLAARDVQDARHAVPVDDERQLPVQQDLDAVTAPAADRRGASCRIQRVARLGTGDAVAGQPGPLLERHDRRRGPRTRPAVHLPRSHEAEVRKALLESTRLIRFGAGRLRRRRGRRRLIRREDAFGRQRMKRDEAGEQTERRTALHQQADRPHVRKTRSREHDLDDPGAQAVEPRPVREFLAEVDRGDAILEGDGPERRAARDLRLDLPRRLALRRAGEESRERLLQRRAGAIDVDHLLALQERDLGRRSIPLRGCRRRVRRRDEHERQSDEHAARDQEATVARRPNRTAR